MTSSARTTSSGFLLPSIHSWPAFFTRQPKSTADGVASEQWSRLFLSYAKHRRLFYLRVEDAETPGSDWDEVLRNQVINRRLLPEYLSYLIDYMVTHNLACYDPPKQTRSVLLYWRLPEEWAETLHDWTSSTGHINTIMTFYEITDPPVPSPLTGIPLTLLKQAIAILTKTGRAQIIGVAEGEGVSPPGSVEQVSRQFRDLGFNVLPGGTHAGGETANALVVFSDTAYLELISFTSPPPPTSDHRWASKSPGWIDYAFLGNGSTTPPTRISDIINSRYSGQGLLYIPEQPGGRTKPNGQNLKWLITAPAAKTAGVLPFFCGDITPREWRVPSQGNDTEHPSSAQGVAFVKVLVPTHNDLNRVSDQLGSVIGSPPINPTGVKAIWRLYNDGTLLEVQLPIDKDEQEFVNTGGIGIYEVGIHVRKGTKSGSIKTPYAKLTWVETD